jgi:hypothetical protein
MKTGWIYKGKDFTESDYEKIADEITGFVYVITDTETGERYIGQKHTKKTKTLPITKTRKRRKKSLVESDWRSYYSSSSIIQQAISEGLSDRYTREILRFGYSKGDLSYLEMLEQIKCNVLIDPKYLNGIINVRIHQKHLSEKLKEELS